jgi:diguanylate cyclase (GGDEF)-like protein
MRVALVEPSRTTRLIVGRMLEARGHQVLPFADELEALAQIKADHSIDALITSAELKQISGLELCWETRLLATCRRPIYVLMMSTQYDQRSLIEALDSGADDFIGKPPLAEELYARLRAAERILSMQRELLRLATTDPLTGLCNRLGFFEQATEACARVVPPDGHLSAIILDIDNFKRINDSYGHETGDEAIRICADAARMQEALTGRLGGDEFALLLEERTLPQAINIAEDLRLKLAGLRYRQRPHHADLERWRRRRKARRDRRPDSCARRCCALQRQARRPEPRGRRTSRAPGATGHRQHWPRPRHFALSRIQPASLAFAFRFSSSRGMISTNEQGRWRLSSCDLRMPSQASRQAPGDPGTQKI